MKSVFALALIALGVSSAATTCSVGPDRDLDIFIVMDLSSSFGTISQNRVRFAAGFTEGAQIVEDAGFQVKSTAARAADSAISNCHKLDTLQRVGVEHIKEVGLTSGALSFTDRGRPSIFHALLWARNRLWSDDKVTDSVRRIFAFVTHNVDEATYYPPRSEYMILSDKAINGSVRDGCPFTYNPRAVQVAGAVRGARAGVLTALYTPYASQGNRANTWRSYYAKNDITDVVVVDRSTVIGNIQGDVAEGLKQLICPEWIQTTSTPAPRGYTKDEIAKCLSYVQPCQTDLSYWQSELEDCLVARF